jgi:hypothetical protein
MAKSRAQESQRGDGGRSGGASRREGWGRVEVHRFLDMLPVSEQAFSKSTKSNDLDSVKDKIGADSAYN